MKKRYFLPAVAVAAVGFFAFQQSNTGTLEKYVEQHLFSSGGQSGLTGAPGENNCTQCHQGSVMNGDQENGFSVRDAALQTVTSYIPGQQYTVSVQLNSAPDKKGFSATALDDADAMAGSFTGSSLGGTQDFSAGGRDYVSHTSTSNTSASTFWAWTWDAPATDVGDVTFYVASNVTNNDGSTNGDVIYLSEHTLFSTASIDEDQFEASFNAGYDVSGNAVVVNFNALVAGDMFFNLVDMNGRSVYSQAMETSLVGENKQTVTLPSGVKNGMYVVHFFVGNKAMSAKVLVQK